MRRLRIGFALALALMIGITAPATATPLESHDCYSKDMMRRIEGCAELLRLPYLPPELKAQAYSMRALALSIIGRYNEAIADYNSALQIQPNSPATLNNRAWALYRMGRINEALPDVQKSLRLDGLSQHAYDTRAHVMQAQGYSDRAYQDYRKAMALGGVAMIRLYQCGLQASGLYTGPVSGIFTTAMDVALRACVKRKDCDPLPPDEECKAALS